MHGALRALGALALIAAAVGVAALALVLPAPGPLRLVWLGIACAVDVLLLGRVWRLARSAWLSRTSIRAAWVGRLGGLPQVALLALVSIWALGGMRLLYGSSSFEVYRHGLTAHQTLGFLLMPPALLATAMTRGRALFGLRAAAWLAAYPLLVMVVQPAPLPLMGNFIVSFAVLPLLLWRMAARSLVPGVERTLALAWYLHFISVAAAVVAGLFAHVSPPDVRFILVIRKLHRIAGPLAFALSATYVLAALGALSRGGALTRRRLAAATACAVLLLATLAVGGMRKFGADHESRRRAVTLPTATAASASSPFRPLPPDALSGSDACGDCHALTHGQWAISGHAHSGRNLAFRASVRQIAGRDGEESVRLCLSCHIPSLGFAEDLSPLWNDSAMDASDGVGCKACHYMVEAEPSNGRYAVALARADTEVGDAERPAFVQSSVLEHLGDVSRPLVADGTGCYPCHSFHAERDGRRLVPYDVVSSYLDSELAGTVVCQDCHMPRLAIDRNQYSWKDHAFFGGQIFLDALLPADADERQREQARELARQTTAWSRGELAHVQWRAFHDEIGLDPLHPVKAVRSQWAVIQMLRDPVRFEMSLEPTGDEPARAGEAIELELELRTRMVGHVFPANLFANVSRTWIDLSVTDASGRVLHVAPERLLGQSEIGPDGAPTHPTEAENYVDVQHHGYVEPDRPVRATYSIQLPADVEPPVVAAAHLRHRRYDPAYLDFIGVADERPAEDQLLATAQHVLMD